ncbi:MAG: hypothetical protein K9H25_22790 [Rhodospirillum sp.]|nr:hypothetical protein [Rhodospirillum sp.]MCF8502660.1 hypothetical protein [Rhodospirillum sp.]
MRHLDRWRTFTAAYKLAILEELDRAKPGETGAVLGREGVYSSSLVTWRKQRAQGLLNSKSPVRRGPAAAPKSGDAAELDRLRRDNTRLERQLTKARLVIGIQEKAAKIMDINLDPTDETASRLWSPKYRQVFAGRSVRRSVSRHQPSIAARSLQPRRHARAFWRTFFDWYSKPWVNRRNRLHEDRLITRRRGHMRRDGAPRAIGVHDGLRVIGLPIFMINGGPRRIATEAAVRPDPDKCDRIRPDQSTA